MKRRKHSLNAAGGRCSCLLVNYLFEFASNFAEIQLRFFSCTTFISSLMYFGQVFCMNHSKKKKMYNMWNIDLKVWKHQDFLPLSTHFSTQQSKGSGQWDSCMLVCSTKYGDIKLINTLGACSQMFFMNMESLYCSMHVKPIIMELLTLYFFVFLVSKKYIYIYVHKISKVFSFLNCNETF